MQFTDDPDLGHGDIILGNAYVEDNVTLNADARIGGSVCAGGNVKISARTVIEGSVYAVGNVELNGDARIGGDVHAGGTSW